MLQLFFFFLEKVEDSIIMKMLGIDVIFGAYITLHNKVLVVLLYLNHSKLGEISLLMSWSLMKSMFLLVNIKLFPRWSTVLSSFISLLKVFLSSKSSRTDLNLQRVLIRLMASGWKMPSDDTATDISISTALYYYDMMWSVVKRREMTLYLLFPSQ